MKWHQARRQQERWNYFKGGMLLSFLAFLSLSFISYSPQDPSLNSFGLSLKVSNFCGYVGAILSDLFFQIFGLSSWLFIPAGCVLALAFFQNQMKTRIFQKTVIFFLFLTSLSSLMNLYFGSSLFYNKTISLGGGFATLILQGLKPFFHTIGTGLVLWTVFIFTFLFYGHKLVFQTLYFVQKFSVKTMRVLLYFFSQILPPFWIQGKNKLVSFWVFSLRKVRDWGAQRKTQKQAQQKEKNQTQELAPPLEEKEIKFRFPQEQAPVTFKPEEQEKEKEKSTTSPSSSPINISLHSEEQKKQNQKTVTFKDKPSLDLLREPPDLSQKMSLVEVENLSKKLVDKLAQFSIHGKITAIKTGPAVIMFEFKPEESVKVSRIKEMASDLSLALSSESVRIIAPIPGRDVVGIEASSPYREIVYLKNMLKEEEFLQASLPLVLGRRSDNKICIRDLARIPHLLIAGTTGSGKSIFVISFIMSLLFRHTPDTLRLILIDPKQVDLSAFKDIPHLLSPIVTSTPQVVGVLKWATSEMEKRYRSLSLFGARDLTSFNNQVQKMSAQEKAEHQEALETTPDLHSYYFEPLPLICIVIEEFGDLMADIQYRKGIENSVVRLAQKARACGIHLVLAMQSPRKDVVTGLIKTNIPGRISFKVSSGTDSRIILDEVGAERLLSHGDMLFLEPGTAKPLRYHGPFVSEKEVSQVVKYWRSQGQVMYEEALIPGAPQSVSGGAGLDDLQEDPMYEEILHFVQTCDAVSASLLQRKFRIGYPRAARLIELLFDQGIVGPPQGSRPREVLTNNDKRD